MTTDVNDDQVNDNVVRDSVELPVSLSSSSLVITDDGNGNYVISYPTPPPPPAAPLLTSDNFGLYPGSVMIWSATFGYMTRLATGGDNYVYVLPQGRDLLKAEAGKILKVDIITNSFVDVNNLGQFDSFKMEITYGRTGQSGLFYPAGAYLPTYEGSPYPDKHKYSFIADMSEVAPDAYLDTFYIDSYIADYDITYEITKFDFEEQ